MRFLVTAGPTREYLDDVRFIGNASSGRMGYAVAAAAARAGHCVDLVSGPVNLKLPEGVRLVSVVSAQEMYRAAAKLFPAADCLVGAAAPADFRPAKRASGKPKKSSAPRTLRLVPTVDILAALGKRKKKRQIMIAFALEVRRPLANALEKMKLKNADAIVINSPDAMAAARSSATILPRGGDRIALRNAPKYVIGRRIVALAEELHAL